jgi:hypothetical protein
MLTNEIAIPERHTLSEMVDYVPNLLVINTIIRKTTENISIVAID